MALSFYIILLLAGGNDLIASIFTFSVQTITWTLRIGLFVIPPLVYVITKRICLGLQHSDRELLHHGIESGTIRRLPSGEFIEETVGLPVPYQITITGSDPTARPALHGAAHAADGLGDEHAVALPEDHMVVDGQPKPRGFFRDKSAPRREKGQRPEATAPELESTGQVRRPE
jgi:ubiquinol-cytochrome c reductase cytochrome b subunit